MLARKGSVDNIFLARRHLHVKHILHLFRGLGFEGVITIRERDKIVEEENNGLLSSPSMTSIFLDVSILVIGSDR